MPRFAWPVTAAFAIATSALLMAGRPAAGCPFCAAVSLTFCEEVNGSDVAVIAKLMKLPIDAKPGSAIGGTGDNKAAFEILEVLKGEKALGKTRKFDALYFGNNPLGSTFLVLGVEPPVVNWSTPIAITDRARAYLAKALQLPKEGPDRLAFFQDYLEDGDEMLARDAYDEFAKTPYAGVKALKDRMHHDKILTWIQDPKVAPSRRRLYLTMLGICEKPQDVALLKHMMVSSDRQVKSGLDALIAAYLTLAGPDGMPFVEDLFLKNKDADYTDTYSAIMALRFHGQEEKVIPRERLLEGIRYMLDRPQLADLVIPDLARWQDWSALDRLVALFKNADDESSWVRVPVINYLRACPLPKAKEQLEELAKIDPESVKKANSFFPFTGAAPAAQNKSTPPAAEDKKPTPGGKKVSGPAPAGVPAGKKSTQVNKPMAESGATSATKKTGKLDASQSASRGGRLSRSGAPAAMQVPRVGALQILGWMALCCGGVAVFLLAILRGGQESVS